jgi:transglutaminase-like putative cysteine protease
MNHRLTLTAAVAVILASVSLFAVVKGAAWMFVSIGAVIAVAAAGTLTRLPAVAAAASATVLTLIASVPLLTGSGWYWPAAGVALVAAVAASATRLRILPVLADIATYLAALLIYLNLAYAGPQSLARIVPTVRSMRHLWYLAGQGWALRFHSPPVPGTHGLVLLTAAGVGLIAVATDVLAVRLRSPAIAGLPLLVLFSVPITTSAKLHGPGATAAFCLGITGYLALLAADGRERLRIWGRLVTVWQTSEDEEQSRGPDTRALAASGRRIGLAAVCAAIIIPLVLPGLSLHDLFGKHSGGNSGGPGVPLPDALVSMNNQLTGPDAGNRTVLTYRTTNPEADTQYLTVFVLNYDSDSGAFTTVTPANPRQVHSGPLLAVPGLAAGTSVTRATTNVTMGDVKGYQTKLSFLPLPYAPKTVTVTGDWQEAASTLMVYSGQADMSGLKYAVTSTEADPSPSQLTDDRPLPAGITNDYLGFSGPQKAALLKIARRITRKQHSRFGKAEALENWFRDSGTFQYSLSTNVPNGPAGLVQFLTSDRRGYCQQFAYAMAILARLVGIPSRIDVGYTAGSPERNGTWKVTEADAHAWPELYFRNAGWLRFEPTPGGITGQGTATVPPYVAAAGGPGSQGKPGIQASPSPSAAPSASATPGAGGLKPRPRAAGGPGGGGVLPGRHSSTFQVVLAAIIVLALAAIAPRTARSLVRRRRWLTAAGAAGLAHAAWRELRDDLDDYGLTCRGSESPRAVARRVSADQDLGESATQALNRIAGAEERARYAAAPGPAAQLTADVLRVRRAVARSASLPTRWRARLLPASILGPVRAALQQSLDVFGWLDAADQKVRRRMGSDATARHEA